MPVIKNEKTKNFTVISNTHLKDRNLSLKAKGLLTQMLSLPYDWEYSISGLAAINKEGKSAIASALRELLDAGYAFRSQETDEKGQFKRMNYIIFESPQKSFPQ